MWLFGGFWAIGVALFVFEYLTNPHDPSLTGIAGYGHTYGSELKRILRLTMVEVVVAAVLLRPWSYRRSWGRAVVAAAVCAPWLLVRAGVGMHGGPTTRAHTLWLLLFFVGLVSAAVVSGFAARRARGRSSAVPCRGRQQVN